METSIKSYAAKEHHQPVKRYCRTLDLRDDPKLIAEYRRRHSQAEIWPEVIAGIREVGILEMEIYILDTRLFMIVETALDFDWDTAMERACHFAPPAGMGRLYGDFPTCDSRIYFRTKMATDGTYVPFIRITFYFYEQPQTSLYPNEFIPL